MTMPITNSPANLIFISAILIVFNMVGIYVVIKAIKKLRMIYKMPLESIRSACGTTHLIGTAESFTQENILTPFSKTPCVWYFAKIQKKRNVNRSIEFETLYSKVHQGFFLHDATGVCPVFTNESLMLVTKNKIVLHKSSVDEYEIVSRLPKSYFNKYILTEEYIVADEQIILYGNVEEVNLDLLMGKLNKEKEEYNQIINIIDQKTEHELHKDVLAESKLNEVIATLAQFEKIPLIKSLNAKSIRLQANHNIQTHNEKIQVLKLIRNKLGNIIKLITLDDFERTLGLLSTKSQRTTFLHITCNELVPAILFLLFVVLITGLYFLSTNIWSY